VQGQPVNQIGKLADPAPDIRADRSVVQDHSVNVALPPGGFSHQPPEGKGLAGPEDNPVHTAGGQFEINYFIVLKPHVHFSQSSQQRRPVPADDVRQ